ncbi:MAG: CrcB family protein [Actinomycetota bacterium]
MKDQVQIGVTVAVGGGLGTLARAAIAQAAVNNGVLTLWAVLFVNVTGALVLGWYAAHVRNSNRWSTLMVGFVAAGILGSFTTFSAFSFEVVELFETGDFLIGSVYAVATIGVGLVAATIGRRFAEQR